MIVKAGRFGEYVTDGEYNATLRKDDTVESITLERAAELLAERRERGPAKKAGQEGREEGARQEDGREEDDRQEDRGEEDDGEEDRQEVLTCPAPLVEAGARARHETPAGSSRFART